MIKIYLASLLATTSLIAPAQPLNPAQGTVADKYHAIQVDRFDIQPGVEFPVDYLVTLQEEILKALQKSQKFKDVLRPGENPSDATASVLRLIGTVTHFKAGSRTKRYLAPGAGSTEIFASVVLLDRSTGESVFAQEVRGIMAGGFIGGESMNVTRDFAGKIVTSATFILEKRLPGAGESPKPPADASPSKTAKGASGSERHTLTLSASDFAGGEQKLNAEAANGYRLVGFAATSSKTADVSLEKSATPPQVYEYKLLHVHYLPHLEKDLNQEAGDGFRLCPHTLVMMGSTVFVITEKPPLVSTTRFLYRVHVTMRKSSSEKDIRKDQAEGYVLSEIYELGGYHITILEKALDKGNA